MIKIYLLIASIKLGGSENVALNIAEYCKLAHPLDFEFVIVELYQTRDTYSLEKKRNLNRKISKLLPLPKGQKGSVYCSPISG